MIGFSWTQLGAFIANVKNLPDAQLDLLASVGGRWVIPVLYEDPDSAADNLARLPDLQNRCASRGIRVGCWANVRGDDPAKYVADIKPIVVKNKLSPLVLDAEAYYQGNTKMAFLVDAFRTAFPVGTKAFAISTNSMNDSQVYNGRKGGYPAPAGESFRAKNVHVLPQWYSSPNYSGFSTHADLNMKWVDERGMEDNWEDTKYADRRAVMKTQIHGTLEVTGLENASLQTTLDECVRARKLYGLGRGISLYLLENTPASDFPLLKAQRGYLYS